jgi:hypothetical protein
VPVVLSYEIDELTVTVVFRNRVSAAPVDTAWDLPVLELEAGIPVDELTYFPVLTESQEGGGRECSVANPLSFV